MMTDLELHTNEELIKELLKRQTFAGIVIRPQLDMEDIELLDPDSVQFDMSWNDRLPTSTVKMLLQKALTNLGEDGEWVDDYDDNPF